MMRLVRWQCAVLSISSPLSYLYIDYKMPQNLSRCLYIVPSARFLPPPGRSQSGASVSSPSLTSDLIQFWSPLTMSKVVPLHHQRGWAADVPWTSELCSLLQLQPPLLGLVRQEGQQKCGYQHFSRGVSLFRFLGCNYHTACIIYDFKYCIIYHYITIY